MVVLRRPRLDARSRMHHIGRVLPAVGCWLLPALGTEKGSGNAMRVLQCKA